MKIGPIDFKQPSTWRGLLIFLGLVGWKVSPELREQIAVTLGMAMATIEMLRDEYRQKTKDINITVENTGPNRAMATRNDADPERMRVPPVSPSNDPDPDPSRFTGNG